MDLRALRYFLSVAQLGGITRAAQALNVAQPALSRQIRKLEEEVGVTLLLRRPRGVELTPAGARLLERAEAVFQSLRETAEELRSETLAGTGRISLGVPPAMGVMLVPELMRRFRATLPQAALYVREGVGHWLVEWVLEQRVDLALVHNPPRLPELEVEPLVVERMVLVLPPAGTATDWPLPPDGEISLVQALQVPLILPTHPHTNRLLLDSVLARGMQPVRPAMEVDSVSITKAMVGAGLGATILTHAAVHGDVLAGRLRAMPIGHPPLISSLALVRLRRHAADLLPERTKGLIRETLSRLARQGVLHGALATSRVLGGGGAKG
ncbi:LysR family transcriptional regulator [Pseudoroseomonas wenyumeiae]|uniref:LysR family transcriptional regulator n=1 Tax=Teichococcus wenyumeiae TaxID=2478470 RepID=A0A3A9JGP1_9PROT|nr:LysR family transcriptional regulator [Pseudoroseomonas wenyumeiae]RKK03685.1 LysR family transcriptional regulator [Pseudoroseomonas wenyumeiae]RMI20541.1 LysR family transcriptional regulator [Pseudoroseomonas wenyumeiae]